MDRKVRVYLLADYARSRRRTNGGTKWINEFEHKFPNLFKSYYYSVNHRAIPFTPSPFNEIYGLFHFKLNVFDGKDVLISGANLSESYFTNRQVSSLYVVLV